jgi:hypothetical protein
MTMSFTQWKSAVSVEASGAQVVPLSPLLKTAATQWQAGAPNVFAKVALTGAYVEDVGVPGVHGHRVDGEVGHRLAHRAPRRARIVGPPDTP